MKKSLILSIVILSIFIVGCLDYKAYDVPEDSIAEEDLLNEIAQIERELGINENNPSQESLDAPVDTSQPSPGDATTADLTDESQNTGVNTEESASDTTDIPQNAGQDDAQLKDTASDVVDEVILPELDAEELASAEPITISVKESENVKLNVKIEDPDEDEVTYTFGPPLNAEGEWQTNYGDSGEYIVPITATDGKLSTQKNIKIVVERVNVAPKITALKDIVAKEGEQIKLTPIVIDPNNDEVTVTVSEPLAKGTFQTDHTSAGEYDIKIEATDGELTSEYILRLTIIDVNVLPKIAGVVDLKVKEGETVTIQPEISDLDEDALTVTISDPVGDDGIWKTGYTDHGEYFITVVVDDGKDKVSQRVKLIVEDVNMPPQIVEVNLVVN